MGPEKENTILLVADNPDDVKLTLRAFKQNNITNPIVVAHDGQEALDYLFGTGSFAEQSCPLPQVVLLDLRLPGMDGTEVLRQIRANPRTELLPVVILTSSTEEQDMIKGYKLGANSYVCKPVDFVHFVEAARELGRYWLVLNETPSARRSNRADVT